MMGRSLRDESVEWKSPIVTDKIEENGTNTVTISNVAPATVGTATIARWLKIRVSNTDYFIPCWT